MTTYNAAAVADAIIAYGKGITLQQGRALRDNPIAIAEGASGAPKVMAAALNIATGSASYSLNPGNMIDLVVDDLAFFPKASPTMGSNTSASMGTSGGHPCVFISNASGITQTVSVSWSYIA